MKGVTKYQLELLGRIVSIKKQTGNFADLDQLLDLLSWSPSKESFQFVVRAVVTKGLVEKTPIEFRRNRNRVCYTLTKAGMLVLDPRSEPEIGNSLGEIMESESVEADPSSTLIPGFTGTTLRLNESLED